MMVICVSNNYNYNPNLEQFHKHHCPLFGLVDELFINLLAAPNGKEMPHNMMLALYRLGRNVCVDQKQQQIRSSATGSTHSVHKANCQKNDPNGQNIPKSLSADEIQSLKDTIFSSIVDIKYIPRAIIQPLVIHGKLTNIHSCALDLKEDTSRKLIKQAQNDAKMATLTQSNGFDEKAMEGLCGDKKKGSNNTNHRIELASTAFNFPSFLPKATNLNSICLNIIASDHEMFDSDEDGDNDDDYDPSAPLIYKKWNPFDLITTPFSINAEHLTINAVYGPWDVLGALNDLFKIGSFPNLKKISFPNAFFSSTDRSLIKSLFTSLSRLPNLVDFMEYAAPYPFSREVIEELAASEVLSKIEKFVFKRKQWQGLGISLTSTRDVFLSSPHIALKELTLDDMFENEQDADKVGEWLFKKEWITNLTSFNTTNCHLTLSFAENLASSPYLTNLTSLTIPNKNDVATGKAVCVILQSSHLSKLQKLQINQLTVEQLAIITSSPHFNNLTSLHCLSAPPTYLQAIVASTTLNNIAEIDWAPIPTTYHTNFAVMGLVELFRSKKLQNFQKIPNLHNMNIAKIPPETFNIFMSSPYVNNITELDVCRDDPNPGEWVKLLATNSAWANLTRLDLSGCHLDDDCIKSITESQYLTQLVHLDLSDNNNLTDQSLVYIAQSPNLVNLTHLSLFKLLSLVKTTTKKPKATTTRRQKINSKTENNGNDNNDNNDSNPITNPIFFSNNALIHLFQSPYLTKLYTLRISLCPIVHASAIYYLILNSQIFATSHWSQTHQKLLFERCKDPNQRNVPFVDSILAPNMLDNKGIQRWREMAKSIGLIDIVFDDDNYESMQRMQRGPLLR